MLARTYTALATCSASRQETRKICQCNEPCSTANNFDEYRHIAHGPAPSPSARPVECRRSAVTWDDDARYRRSPARRRMCILLVYDLWCPRNRNCPNTRAHMERGRLFAHRTVPLVSGALRSRIHIPLGGVRLRESQAQLASNVSVRRCRFSAQRGPHLGSRTFRIDKVRRFVIRVWVGAFSPRALAGAPGFWPAYGHHCTESCLFVIGTAPATQMARAARRTPGVDKIHAQFGLHTVTQ